MHNQDCEIKKIILIINGQEISLTIEQCKKLKESLNKIFEKDTVYIPNPYPYKEYIPVYPKTYLPWKDTPWITYYLDSKEFRCSL